VLCGTIDLYLLIRVSWLRFQHGLPKLRKRKVWGRNKSTERLLKYAVLITYTHTPNIAGVLVLIGSLVIRSLIPNVIPFEIPPEIMLILPLLITDITSPLQTYSIALLIVGIILIVLSSKLKSPDYAS